MSELFRFNVALTDDDWYASLAKATHDEVNFWQPSPTRVADPLGTPWLFKLHAPKNYIVGGGFFVHYTRLTPPLAWQTFAEKNGTSSLDEFLERIQHYSKGSRRDAHAHEVGCVILAEPFFFSQQEWIPVPTDWKPHIQRGRHYGMDDPLGHQLWNEVMARLSQRPAISALPDPERAAFGKPILVAPRLGQGAFRATVLDAYGRRCAITGERTLPVLEAAHIRPYRLVKEHTVQNGLALRSDLHTLFDLGYVSVRPDGIFQVSSQIREEYENGREYYALHGQPMRSPEKADWEPLADHLDWHYSTVFRG